MSDLLTNLSETIQNIITSLGYPGIALVMFLENVFPPIPSELIMPYAGFLAGRGEFHFLGVWLAGVIGSVAGAVVLYYLGLWAGENVVRTFLRRYGRWVTVSENDYDRALRFFARYGEVIVFFGRLIPIIRSIISIPAGANRMPMQKFLLYTTLGSAIWSGMLAYAGLALGKNWERVMGWIEQYQNVTVIALAIGGVTFVGWWPYQKSQPRPNDSEATS